MQKILATLKSRKGSCWLAILFCFFIGVSVYQYMDRLNLQISNEKLQKTVEEQQTEKKQLQLDKEELQADNEKLQTDKEKLEEEKENLQTDKTNLETESLKLSMALKKQLSREINLKREDSSMSDDWNLCPIVGVASDVPVSGYAQDTKSNAKKVPLLLKSEYSKVFFQLKLSSKIEKNQKIYFFEPEGRKLEPVVKKKRFILVPLNKKGIYYLKFSDEKTGDKYYVALKWKGKSNK